MFLNAVLVMLLSYWSLTVGKETQDVTKREADFATIFNGNWDNTDQIQEGSNEHVFIQLRILPVDIPVLRPATVVYVEEAVNGITNILNLAVVTEGPDKNIHLTVYNFTNTAGLKFGTYNLDDLANITLNDLHGDENCTVEFQQMERQLFVGKWTVCNYVINGRHPLYTLIYTCNHQTATMPMDVKETSAHLPYKYKHIGERYPLVQVPHYYVSPCVDFD